MPRPTAASRVMPIDWSTRPSSSIARQRLVKPPLAGQPGAAVLLGCGQTEQPEVAHLADHVDREVVVAVPLGRVRGDLLLGEVAHGAAELFVLGGSGRNSWRHPRARLTIVNPQGVPRVDVPGIASEVLKILFALHLLTAIFAIGPLVHAATTCPAACGRQTPAPTPVSPDDDDLLLRLAAGGRLRLRRRCRWTARTGPGRSPIRRDLDLALRAALDRRRRDRPDASPCRPCRSRPIG